MISKKDFSDDFWSGITTLGSYIIAGSGSFLSSGAGTSSGFFSS
jgi:hypothetical protein